MIPTSIRNFSAIHLMVIFRPQNVRGQYGPKKGRGINLFVFFNLTHHPLPPYEISAQTVIFHPKNGRGQNRAQKGRGTKQILVENFLLSVRTTTASKYKGKIICTTPFLGPILATPILGTKDNR